MAAPPPAAGKLRDRLPGGRSAGPAPSGSGGSRGKVPGSARQDAPRPAPQVTAGERGHRRRGGRCPIPCATEADFALLPVPPRPSRESPPEVRAQSRAVSGTLGRSGNLVSSAAHSTAPITAMCSQSGSEPHRLVTANQDQLPAKSHPTSSMPPLRMRERRRPDSSSVRLTHAQIFRGDTGAGPRILGGLCPAAHCETPFCPQLYSEH